ncbi:hypothetical protein [Oceanithermus sp.]|uniref:hypothetical protein n=1 Tax=Oceanithermus sp. TaxID=2268145 RepID=UPI0025E18708|nr:hypothetical protein [Oceanithermus sp.]
MKQVGGVLERTLGYALAFAKSSALGLVLAGLFVAVSRLLHAATAWSMFATTPPADMHPLAPLASPLAWAGTLAGWFATAWMAYLVVGWLQRMLYGREPAFPAAVGVALGAGLPLLAVNVALALMLWLAPFPAVGGAYWVYSMVTLVALVWLLPAMVYAAVHAGGFRAALERLAETLRGADYARLLARPGFWAALAPLVLWLVLAPWLGGLALQLDLNRSLEAQFYRLLVAEALRGFLTTVVGLPIVAAVLRSVYDVVWGSPGKASATPAPPAA